MCYSTFTASRPSTVNPRPALMIIHPDCWRYPYRVSVWLFSRNRLAVPACHHIISPAATSVLTCCSVSGSDHNPRLRSEVDCPAQLRAAHLKHTLHQSPTAHHNDSASTLDSASAINHIRDHHHIEARYRWRQCPRDLGLKV